MADNKTPNQLWLEQLGKKPSQLTKNDIIAYCRAQGKVAWLKETARKKVVIDVYPKLVNEDGTTTNKADKSKAPTPTEVRIPFTMFREEFITTFMPELKKPKKAKKLSWWEEIEALED